MTNLNPPPDATTDASRNAGAMEDAGNQLCERCQFYRDPPLAINLINNHCGHIDGPAFHWSDDGATLWCRRREAK